MDITKYHQSCLKLTKNNRSILFDLGSLATAEYRVEELGRIDAVIYTHSHGDHLDIAVVDKLIESGATLYGNADVAKTVGNGKVEVIEDGEELVVAGFKLKAFHMEHCLMVDGSKGVPNTGFLVDDHLLIPGDSTEQVGITAEIVAVPIFGPDISYHDAFEMAEAYEAKTVIPVHFDVARMDPTTFEFFTNHVGARGGNYKVAIIPNGETRSFELKHA